MKDYSGSDLPFNGNTGENYPITLLAPSDGVVGTVTLNQGEPIAVDPQQGDSPVSPGIPVYSLAGGTPTQVKTSLDGGSDWQRYIYWEGEGEARQYYESVNSSGTPRTLINTLHQSDDHLVLNLIVDNDTIVIGTIIIDVEM